MSQLTLFPVLARELFQRTRGQEAFSINDFRKHKFNELLGDPSKNGEFFRYLNQKGFVARVGVTYARHKEARGRMVSRWAWTEKAWAWFNQ